MENIQEMINKCNLIKYCCDKISEIENYEQALSSDEIFDCHHRLETHTSDGERRLINLTKKELIALGMYYNRPASELILLPHSKHTILHNPRLGTGQGPKLPKYGKLDSKELREHLSSIKKGKHLSKEQVEKMKGMFTGIKSSLAIPVKVAETGDVFGSKREAERAYGRHSFDSNRKGSSRTRRKYYTLIEITREEYFSAIKQEELMKEVTK